MTLTTSGGSACMSSKGVSKILESTFIITTSSRPFSRTLCNEGWEGGTAAQSSRIPGRGGYLGMQRVGGFRRPRSPVPLPLTSARLAWTPMR